MDKLLIQQHIIWAQQFYTWCFAKGYEIKTCKELQKLLIALLLFAENHQYNIHANAISLFMEHTCYRLNFRQQNTLSTSYIQKHNWMAKLFVEFLLMVHHISINIKIPNLSRTIKPRNILSQQQIKILYQWIDQQSDKPFFDLAIIAIFYHAGLRRTEGLKLNINDLNYQSKTISIRKGKGGKARTIPLHQITCQHLQNYIQYHRPSPTSGNRNALFISSRLRPMSPRPIINRLKIWKPVLNFHSPLTLHSFRHSIATHLLQNGMDIKLIQSFLGHRSLASTQLYTHISTS